MAHHIGESSSHEPRMAKQNRAGDAPFLGARTACRHCLSHYSRTLEPDAGPVPRLPTLTPSLTCPTKMQTARRL